MVGSPLPFAGSELVRENPPVPVSAVINAPMTEAVVTFDRAMFPNPTPNIGNWTIRWANQLRTMTSGNVTGLTATLNLTPGGADVGDDIVSFDPPPFDILDNVTLRPVTPFTDFPLTM